MNIEYKPGDVILDNSFPVMKFLMDKRRKDRCNNCFKRSSELIPCTSCKVYNYCSPDCLSEDFDNGHSIECKSHCFKNYCVTGSFTDVKRIVFRMYANLKLHPELQEKSYTLHDDSERTFKDLATNLETIQANKILANKCLKLSTIMSADSPSNKVELVYVAKLMGIHYSNSLAITDWVTGDQIGYGIYVEPSIFDHSCKNNAVYLTLGLKLQVRIIAKIPAGAKLCISYIDDAMCKLDRRKLLWQLYSFYCNCQLCTSDEEATFDYVAMEAIRSKMSDLSKGSATCAQPWEEVKKEHYELIAMFKKICHDYAVPITSQHVKLLKIALELKVEKDELKVLYETALRHLLITRGNEHNKYLTLESEFKVAFP